MNEAKVTPTFVVVGHPNKGKSSIVATLAQDEAVGIADESGTTTTARHFPMRVDGDDDLRGGRVFFDLGF